MKHSSPAKSSGSRPRAIRDDAITILSPAAAASDAGSAPPCGEHVLQGRTLHAPREACRFGAGDALEPFGMIA